MRYKSISSERVIFPSHDKPAEFSVTLLRLLRPEIHEMRVNRN